MTIRHAIFRIFILLVVIALAGEIFAQQDLPYIRVSPKANVSQNISFATIEIDYSRPGKRDRVIWGELVPYGLAPNVYGNGKPMPWRTGANENTTISFSHDVKVNSKDVSAGKYGVHMLVNEDEWTVIFSKDAEAWGSFFYEDKNDALRFKVKPQKVPAREWMMFGFENLSANSTDVFLHWGEIKVVFKVEVDQHKIVLDTYREQLTTLPGFYQAPWGTAARYCMQNNINLDEGMVWIDKALGMNGGDNFNNKTVKAGLLTAKGQNDEADKLLESSVDDATENELNRYGYQLMGQSRLDDAIKIFRLNIKKHPESWNVYDSLGEALAKKGDTKGAREYYEKAYNMAPAAQKAQIEGILKGLED